MRFLFVLLLLVLPAASLAQSDDADDGSFIQRLLENALSAEGREVRLEGFRGALSSTAEIDRIVVTDPDGVWLTAEDVSMQWRRAALLRGRINIDEIRIGRLDLPRLPLPAPQEAPSPEARGPISLPELPVEIQLGALTLVTADIGAPVLGEALTISATGSASLAGGEGMVALDVTRQDREGAFRVAGGFSNETRVLSVDVSAREPEGGLVATLLDIPDTPSLALSVAGDGPLDDFAADLALATGGEDRVTGRVTLQGETGETEGVAGGQRFAANISGDITPLLDPIYHEFLGSDIVLAAEGLRAEDGALSLDRLDLSAEALTLRGSARLAADGWPEAFDVDLDIAPVTGDEVVLPLPGDLTSLRGLTLAADFDASTGRRWTVTGNIDGLQQPDFGARDIALDASGTIDRDGPRVDGLLDLVADGLRLADPALQEAVGSRLQAGLRVDWQPDVPVRVSAIDINGADYGLTGTLEVDGLDGALAVALRPDLLLRAGDLSRFAGLSGLDLTGAAEVRVAGAVTPVEGGFDLAIDGATTDLALGIAEADPLLAGTGIIGISATRDTAGLRLPRLRIETDAARIDGTADVAEGTTNAQLRAEIYDTSLAVPAMRGPAELDITASGRETTWRVDGTVGLPGETNLALDGDLDLGPSTEAISTVALTGRIGDLSVFSQLAGQPLSGEITLEANGRGNVASQTGTLRVDSSATRLRTGIPQADGLLRGESDLVLAVERLADGRIQIETLALDAPGVSADGSGALLGDAPGTVDLVVRLPDVAPLLPGLNGGATLDVSATTEGSTWDVTGTAALPGDTALDIAAFADLAASNAAQSTVSVSGTVGDLAAFSELAGQDLAGSVTLTAEGTGDIATQSGQLRLDTDIRGLRTGIPQADGLLRGDSALALAVARRPDGTIVIDRLDLDAPGVTADGTGQLLGDDPGTIELAVRMPDLSPLVSVLPGAADLSLNATQTGARWDIEADVNAPGGTQLRTTGTVAADASDVDLSVTGNAPLAIANSFLSGQTIDGPLNFDLAVNGAPGLDAVSGRLTIGNTRFAMPSAELELVDLRGDVALAGGRAQVDLTSRFVDGGTLDVTGPITLSAPFNSDLEILLRDAILSQADLLETRVNGAVSLSGALTGGASIGGELLLDPLEIQIPSIGPSYSSLDGLRHEDLPAEVRQTLLSARLISASENAGPGASFPIDLLIRAPQRIFVRGRGLDAELGGQIRITGRTNDIVPIGQFDLLRGNLELLTRDLSLDVGNIDIQGSFDPVILFSASSTVEGVQITIRIEGPASDPELQLTSVPELPEDEVLSLFLFGSRIDNISPLQAVRLANAARTLSGRGGLGYQSIIRESLGVDSFDVNVDEAGNAEASVGAYIGENLYTDVTVNSQGETQIELNLEVTDSTTVRGGSTSTGESTLGIFFERDY